MKRVIGLAVMLFCIILLPGCSGCWKQDSDEPAEAEQKRDEAAKEKEKPKPDFEVVERLRVLPSDDRSDAARQRFVKPGHWMTATEQLRANNFDFLADLQAAALDRQQHVIDVEHTNYHMVLSRPASLPKEQVKSFEMTYFIPRRPDEENRQIWLDNQLFDHRSGRVAFVSPEPTTRMPEYQFFFVVLAAAPDRYSFLATLDSVVPSANNFAPVDDIQHYRVVRPKLGPRVPLPSSSLTWSPIAYVLWDQVDPGLLEPDQQQSLLDWLHWGGQLIISGPGSFDTLGGSFLEPYLPAAKGQSVELRQDAFDELNAHWSLVDNKQTRRALEVVPSKPPVGIELKKHPAAQFLPQTGELVVERRVGRGRIVLTAFALSDRAITNWGSFDGFFNGCLLRRPAREFREGDVVQPIRATWKSFPGMEKDARLTSTLRYFSRDAGETKPRLQLPPQGSRRTPDVDADPWHFGGYQHDLQSGVGGWSDTSAAANAARQTLKHAGGISPPRSNFVLGVLSVYLLVLVPVNWGVFRLIGRVEWAWFAAPIIAIGGAVLVVRQAQLDIGFVRSRTEVAVLELHGGYPRGHLTRYTALYTSLSTGYEFQFDEPSSLAQPFAVDPNYERHGFDSPMTVVLRTEQNLRLKGFQLLSNTSSIVHCEQMYDPGGSITLAGDERQGFRVVNDSNLTVRDVGVLRRTDGGRLEAGWIGELQTKSGAAFAFRTVRGVTPRIDQWNDSPTMLSYGREAKLLAARLDKNSDGFLSQDELAGEDILLRNFTQADRPFATRQQPKPVANDHLRYVDVRSDDDSDTVQNQRRAADEPRKEATFGHSVSGDNLLDIDELAECCRLSRAGQLNLGRLADLASEQLELAPGEVRLIGWSDDELPGVEIRPHSSQTVQRTLLLVHLRPGRLPEPVPDVNTKADVRPDDNRSTRDAGSDIFSNSQD